MWARIMLWDSATFSSSVYIVYKYRRVRSIC